MALIVDAKFSKVLHNELKDYFNDFYSGKIKYPCDEDCLEGCNGEHYYELPDFSGVTFFSPQKWR